jgi:uncharacterized protein (DUF2062 family)
VRTAVAIGLGVAVGFLPIVPLQGLTALLLAFLFRLNRVAALLGTLVWQPFTAPFILAAQWAVGRVVLAPFTASPQSAADLYVWPLIPGSLIVALLAGVLASLASLPLLRRRARQSAAPSVKPEEEG